MDLVNGKVELVHGSGGRAMAELLQEIFFPAFDNEYLRQGNDQALFPVSGKRMVMTTDSHVISPLFFPGGDIGKLAVNGTINDIAMGGAVPLYLSAGFIIEEGFPLADLQKIAISMGEIAKNAGVPIVTGDTKVVEKGKADGVFINTAGVGMVPDGIELSGNKPRKGDLVIVSGNIGDHGIAVLSCRKGMDFSTNVISDTAPLHQLVRAMIAAVPGKIKCLRDPTRGGLAAVLNELALQAKVGMMIKEKNIPILPEVKAACDFLGFDPLNLANEGKLVAICSPESSDTLIRAMHHNPLGRQAAIIGEIIDDENNLVHLETIAGGVRIIDWLYGDQLPRIC